jgi:hypothetical protein
MMDLGERLGALAAAVTAALERGDYEKAADLARAYAALEDYMYRRGLADQEELENGE